jgi:microsomal dipeptidase-like Zn-dependent dipeptidase
MTKEVAGLSPTIDALQFSNWNETIFKQWREAGMRAVHVTTAVWENSVEAQRNLADWRRRFEEHKTLIRPVHDEADLDRAIADDVTGVIFGFQGSSPIENDVSLVETFHRLGVRVMQLTYNNQSFIGGGCYETFDAGITRFGHEVIREMNRLGMIIDLSHCGEKTTNDAIEISERSVAITHANPASVHGSIRNKTDATLKLLAEHDGILGLSLYPFHLPSGSDTTLDQFVQVAEYAVGIVGEDRVGIGSDLAQGWSMADLDWIRSGRWTMVPDLGEGSPEQRGWPPGPAWFQDSTNLPAIGAHLAERMGEGLAEKLMWKNWNRFFRAAMKPQ